MKALLTIEAGNLFALEGIGVHVTIDAALDFHSILKAAAVKSIIECGFPAYWNYLCGVLHADPILPLSLERLSNAGLASNLALSFLQAIYANYRQRVGYFREPRSQDSAPCQPPAVWLERLDPQRIDLRFILSMLTRSFVLWWRP